MKRHWKAYCVSLFLSCFVVILASCQSDSEETGALATAIKVGDLVPDFTLAGSNGNDISSTSLKGQVYILNFFDTGCPDCQQELQVLQQIFDKYKGKALLLNVPRSQTKEEIQAYWDKANLTMPFYIPKDKNLYYKFAQRTIPRTYVVDSSGKVHAAFADSPVADYDSLDGILQQLLKDVPDNNGDVRMSMKVKVAGKRSKNETMLPNEVAVSKLVLWFFDSDTKQFSRKMVLTDYQKTEVITETNYTVTYNFDNVRVPIGVYDIFAIANYTDSMEFENEMVLLNLIDCKTYESGLGANILPEEGPVMTSNATSLLNIDLVPYKGQVYVLTLDLERVMAKLQIGVKKNVFELRHEGERYASVNITNYKIVNLNTCYYLFQHVDYLPVFEEQTTFVMSENFGNYSEEGDNYVVDPFFYKKKPNSIDLTACGARYVSWYGDFKTDDFASMPPAGNFGNVYLLENTTFRTSQKNGYSPGIVFKAAVSPDAVYLWDKNSNQPKPEKRPEYWPETIYLYKCKFYGSIQAVNHDSGAGISNKPKYTDAELKNYGVKQCIFNMGVYETYYTYWIEHRQESPDMGPMKYGIVRNNHYILSVDSITGIGFSSIVPDIMRDNYPNSFADVIVTTP